MTELQRKYASIESAGQDLVKVLGKNLRIGTPLGLGKPNQLLNWLYDFVKGDSTYTLDIYTALSLNPPSPASKLAKAFFVPFRDRYWGKDYPALKYAKDAVGNCLPSNIRVHEFYFQAGTALKSPGLQQRYQSINYTHVAENIYRNDIDVIFQMIAARKENGKTRYSLSCNSDLTLDLADIFRENGKSYKVVAVVHPDLPFLGGEAEVPEDFFATIIEDPQVTHQLFALPRQPIDIVDHCIGYYASQLVLDGGTLQIGIGSLSDAIVNAMVLRHENNDKYLKAMAAMWNGRKPSRFLEIDSKPFEKGIYGLSEMVMDGFMHLRKRGILKRKVTDEKSGKMTYLHGAFYLGSSEFYSWLRGLEGEDYSGIRMSRISKINDLYDPNELHLRKQRQKARFCNTCMQVTLLGGAASETLQNANVVSGVGGQYNFVSMAHELKDARSILMVRSTRTSGGKRSSNLIWSHGHLTIPRHLRDIVITEYGIADLRGCSDEETIIALLEIADSEFQPALMKTAKEAGKLREDYEIPSYAQSNTPSQLKKIEEVGKSLKAFERFPLGTDFTPVEQNLTLYLEKMQEMAGDKSFSGRIKLVKTIIRGMRTSPEQFQPELERLNLVNPTNSKDRLAKFLLLGVIEATLDDARPT